MSREFGTRSIVQVEVNVNVFKTYFVSPTFLQTRFFSKFLPVCLRESLLPSIVSRARQNGRVLRRNSEMSHPRRDSFHAAPATAEPAVLNKRAFREKHRTETKRSRRSRGGARYVDGFGAPWFSDLDTAEDTDGAFHGPSACGIVALVLLPLVVAAAITACRARQETT